jgi:hypothetical protein
VNLKLTDAHSAADLFRRDPTPRNAAKAAQLLWPVLSALYDARSELRRGEKVAEYVATILRINRHLAEQNEALRIENHVLRRGAP